MSPRNKRQKTGHTEPVELKIPSEERIQKILDVIKKLRAHGLDNEIDLPKAVVCGDTSSGKSSVLTRLTGLPFPSGEGVVTKFATEVSMRPSTKDEVQVSILPDEHRASAEQARLENFKQIIELNDFQDTLAEAQKLISAQGRKRNLFRDVLRIDIKGPECQPLTVIDLPGLIQAADNVLTDYDLATSKKLVEDHIKGPRTIVLCVVSALNDVVNQPITQMARKEDPHGMRTMGIITKPDAVDGIKLKEKQWIALTENQRIVFHLGWHVLVNKIEGFDTATPENIDNHEKRFFAMEKFSEIDKDKLGLVALRQRLVKLIGRNLVGALPELEKEITARLDKSQARLDKLGNARSTPAIRRDFLLQLSKDFQAMAKDAIHGTLSDATLEELLRHEAKGEAQTLRASIEGLHYNFRNAMIDFGASLRLKDASNRPSSISATPDPAKHGQYKDWNSISKVRYLDHAQAINWVTSALKSYRGNELLGSPSIYSLAHLFAQMSANWESLSLIHLENVKHVCETFVNRMVEDAAGVNAREVAERIKIERIGPKMEEVKNDARNCLSELARDERGLPRTYDTRLFVLRDHNTTLRNIERAERITNNLYTSSNSSESDFRRELAELRTIRNSIVEDQSNLSDLNRPAAESTLDLVEAYYKLRIPCFIDAIMRQVIERHMVRKVTEAVSWDWAVGLSEEEIELLAAEPEARAVERKTLEKTIKRMQFALKELQHGRADLSGMSE